MLVTCSNESAAQWKWKSYPQLVSAMLEATAERNPSMHHGEGLSSVAEKEKNRR